MGSRVQQSQPNMEPTLHEILEAIESSSPDSRPTNSDDCLNSSLFSLPSSPNTCVLCSLVSAAVARGIKSLFAEFVNDPDSRLRMRSARGFCGEHSGLVAATGDTLGISILYADLADQTLQRWSRGAAGITTGNRMIGQPRITPCPACELETEADKRYVGALATGMKSETVWNRLSDCACLCVVHVERVAASSTHENAGRLLKMESEKLTALIAELNENIRKHDYRFRNEEWGAERDAWRRALNRLTRP